MFVRYLGTRVCWSLKDGRFYIGDRAELNAVELAACERGGDWLPLSFAIRKGYSMLTTQNVLRRCRFAPYVKGQGPTFQLVTWDTGSTIDNKAKLGYRLTMREGRKTTVLFEGEDFGCSPCHCIDSDEAVASLMAFLTLRPGDTDKEYFDGYTATQLDYCQQHADALGCLVSYRFGDI